MDLDLTDYEITERMIRFGGSFVQGLGRLWQRADVLNRVKLKEAFPEYWAEYRELDGLYDANDRMEG